MSQDGVKINRIGEELVEEQIQSNHSKSTNFYSRELPRDQVWDIECIPCVVCPRNIAELHAATVAVRAVEEKRMLKPCKD